MTQVDMLKDMFHKQELLNQRIGVNCAAMTDEQRQQWILRRMGQTGALTREEYERAATEPLDLRAPRQDFAAPHFVDLLMQRRGILPAGGGSVKSSSVSGLA
mgnify:CR=1 FL=1